MNPSTIYAVVECGLVFGAEKVLFLIKFEDYEIYFMFLGTTVGAFNDFLWSKGAFRDSGAGAGAGAGFGNFFKK